MPGCGCLSFPKEAGKIGKQGFRCLPGLDPDLMEPSEVSSWESAGQFEQLMALSLLFGQALIDLGIYGPCVKFPAPRNGIQRLHIRAWIGAPAWEWCFSQGDLTARSGKTPGGFQDGLMDESTRNQHTQGARLLAETTFGRIEP